MSHDPEKAFTEALADYKSGNSGGTFAKLLRLRREAVKERMTAAGLPPTKREQLVGAAEELLDFAKDLEDKDR